MFSKELLKGVIETIILKLLSENEMMYGYEITQKVKEITRNKISISEGALYSTLHKLEALGWVNTNEIANGKRIRKYYFLTKSGTISAQNKIAEMGEFIETINNLMNIKFNGSWSI
jgi:DNA-binding PadR family transcriptional regulator